MILPILTICIPTIDGREHLIDRLWQCINRCIIAPEDISVIIIKDNKEISIGAKRQKLLDRVGTEYMVMIDDDDLVPDYYLYEVLQALESKPDCIGYLEKIEPSGAIACHSNRFQMWGSAYPYKFVRTIFHKDVIRTDIARQIGFKDMRYGEDHDFSIRLKQSGLLQNEVFIDKIMYIYNDPGDMTEEQRKKRYGINE